MIVKIKEYYHTNVKLYLKFDLQDNSQVTSNIKKHTSSSK